MDDLLPILTAVIIFGGCGCLLPIIAIYYGIKKAQNDTDRKTEIMIKAIENGQKVDAQLFGKESARQKNIKLTLLGKLKAGIMWSIMGLGTFITTAIAILDIDFEVVFYIFSVICLAAGIANIVFYIVGLKQLKGEMEAELKQAEKEAEKTSL